MRRLSMGGMQGRGDPPAGRVLDRDAVAIAAHVYQATPGLLRTESRAARAMYAWHANWPQAVGDMLSRRRHAFHERQFIRGYQWPSL